MTSAADVSAADVPVQPRIARGTGLDRAFEILCFSAATFLLTALGGIVISLAIGGSYRRCSDRKKRSILTHSRSKDIFSTKPSNARTGRTNTLR